MTVTKTSAAPKNITNLAALSDLRVWSVIITIFGDAVQPRGGVVSASVLSAITERFAIKPEALRVALFRLAKDGWITRTKSGRNSFYGLSESGQAEFLAATKRIYATAPVLCGPWRLIGLPSKAETARARFEIALKTAGFTRLSPTLFLGATQAGIGPDGVMCLTGEVAELPAWARDAIAPVGLQQDYEALGKALRDLRQSCEDLEPLDAVALRILMIHQWRRLLLRHADLPEDLMPNGWQGEACRSLVIALHKNLSTRADPWLDDAISA